MLASVSTRRTCAGRRNDSPSRISDRRAGGRRSKRPGSGCGCAAGIVRPRARRSFWICSVQPGLAEASRSGFDGEDVVRLPRADLVRALRLDEVVDPGASAALVAVGDLDELEAGDRREELSRGRRMPCACARWQASWYATRAADRVARAPRAASAGQELHDVADARGKRRRSPGPRGVVREETSVVLHVRPAAGRIDEDRVAPASLSNRCDRVAGRSRAPPPRARRGSRARRSTLPGSGRGRRSPPRRERGCVAALTSGKKTRCTQPARRARLARGVVPTAGVALGSRTARSDRTRCGGSERVHLRDPPREQREDPASPDELLEPRPRIRAQRGGEPREPSGYGKRPEDHLAVHPVGRSAPPALLDGRARVSSIRTSYRTPEGQAVMQAMHPRHRSKCAMTRVAPAGSFPPRAPASGRCAREASPSPRPTRRTSGRRAGRSRSARSRRAGCAAALRSGGDAAAREAGPPRSSRRSGPARGGRPGRSAP